MQNELLKNNEERKRNIKGIDVNNVPASLKSIGLAVGGKSDGPNYLTLLRSTEQ